MNTDDLYSDALSYAMRLISRRGYTVHQMRQKLFQKGFESVSDSIIADLEKEKALDDVRYVREWIDVTARRRGYGYFKILASLQQKGLERELIQDTYHVVYADDERDIAHDVFTKKLATFSPDLPVMKQKEKIARFMQSRGFSTDIIVSLLDELG